MKNIPDSKLLILLVALIITYMFVLRLLGIEIKDVNGFADLLKYILGMISGALIAGRKKKKKL